MRSIIFRGKRIHNGEWVDGSPVFYGEKVIMIEPKLCIKELPSFGWVQGEVIPETVGQFTGLTDKNGKKVFEGDILSIETYVGESTNPTWKNVTEHEDTLFTTYYCTRRDEAIVRFNQYKCEFDLKVYNSGRYKRISKFKKVSLEYYHAEIIGNIHDNKEFAEVKE